MNLSEVLELSNKLSIIYGGIQEKVDNIIEEGKKEANEIDKKWLEKLHTKCGLKTDKNVSTASEAISMAKKQRESILKTLSKGNIDAKTQIKLSEDLIYLNNVILSYQNEFDKKEEAKREILRVKANQKCAQVVKSSIEVSIEEIEKEISRINNFLTENSAVNCKNPEELKNITDNVNEKFQLEQLKQSLAKLLSFNAYSYNDSYVKDLVADLPIKYQRMLEKYYLLMNKNSINMKVLKDLNNGVVTVKESNDDVKESNNDVNEINYYLDIARNNHSKKALDYAANLIKKLDDEEAKDDLQAEAAEINELISGQTELYDYDKEEKLVSKAEQTEKFADYARAYNACKELHEDDDKKLEFAARLDSLQKLNNDKFIKLKRILLDKIVSEEPIEQSEIIELSDRYQYISKDIFEKFKKDYEEIINVYNNQVQNEYQEELEKNDFEHYSFIEKFREFASKPIIWVSKTKIASKINKKIINRIREKSDSYSKFTKKIASRLENKIENSVKDGDVINSYKLFKSRNDLAKIKPKLYKGEELTRKQNKKYVKASNRIEKELKKGLDKLSNNEDILNDNSRVITILDQYVDLIAMGTYNEENVEKALYYLDSVKDVLTEGEYNAYYEQILMINNYRHNNEEKPYEYSKTDEEGNKSYEVEEILKYYDSDAYKVLHHPQQYIKRK